MVRPENISKGSPPAVLKSLSGFQNLQKLSYTTQIVVDPAALSLIGNLNELQELRYTGFMHASSLHHIASGCRRLKKLNLCAKGSVGDSALKELKVCSELEYLKLSDFRNTDAGLAELVAVCACLQELICCAKTVIGRQSLSALAGCSLLQKLALCYSSGSLSHLEDVVRYCKSLREISLCEHPDVFDVGNMPPSNSVEVLHLENQAIPDDDIGFHSLRHWHSLRELGFYCYMGTAMILDALSAESEAIRHVAKIELCGCGDYADDKVRALQSRLQPCSVEREDGSSVIFSKDQ